MVCLPTDSLSNLTNPFPAASLHSLKPMEYSSFFYFLFRAHGTVLSSRL